MRELWGRVLVVLALISVLAIFAVSMGLVPARTPPAPRTVPLDLAKAVDSRAPSELAAAAPKPQPALTVSRFSLCKAPAEGARAQRVVVGAAREGLAVFCAGGFELFSFEFSNAPELSSGAPDRFRGHPSPVRAQRLARFRTHAALSGGVAGGDFDGDGAFDLVFGTAPTRGVLHEAGVGVYWVRGRVQGGYEAPRVLAETASAAIVASDLDGTPPSELLVLTRGDVAAQRPGELWAFGKGPLISRLFVLPVGLDPRDLFVHDASLGVPAQALAITGQPGAVWSASLALPATGAPAAGKSLPLVGAQGFVRALVPGELPLVRTPSDVFRVQTTPELQAEPWAQKANAGPGLWSADSAAGAVRVIAALSHGVGELKPGEDPLSDELVFGDDVRVLDLVAVSDASGRARMLALAELGGELSFWLVPPTPWGSDVALTVERAPLDEAQGFADVPLE